MRLSTLRIGINTFAVYTIGQPMRYVMYTTFCTNTLIISSMSCTLPGYIDQSSGKPLDTFKLLNPGTQFIMGYA